MDPSVGRRIGPLELRLVGLDEVPERTARWARALFAPVPHPRDPGAGGLTIVFTADLPPARDRFRPHPLGPAPNGLWVADHRGRQALLPLANLDHEPVLVHPEIDFFFFHEWVCLPLVRARLWAAGAYLLRAAGFAVDGRGIALTGASAVGKTLTVLRAVRGGAQFLGDDFLGIDRTGTVSPLTQLLGLRDEARSLVPPQSRVIRQQRPRRAAVSASRWLSRVTEPWPQVSIGFSRLADAGWRLGLDITGLQEVWPGHAVSAPVPLALVVLLGSGERATSTPRLAERLAAQARLDVPACALLEDAFRQAHPSPAGNRLFPPFEEEVAFLSAALAGVEVAVASDGVAADAIVAQQVAQA
ncbi:MAG: hypothetical protein ACRDUY_13760 [Nitriliruptorales bacterium]